MHVKATLSSFCVVLALYGLYGYVFVPLVLPDPGSSTQTVSVTPISIGNSVRGDIEPYLDLVPADGWERDPSGEIHLFQLKQMVIIFGKDIREGKVVRLEPCTIICLPDDKEHFDEAEQKECIRQSIMLSTSQYAEIEFDGEVDFKADFSKMQGLNLVCARLFGKVKIQSDMKEPGTHDDFSLETENIVVTESPALTKVETLRDVQFALGKHFGTGTGLTIDLTQTDENGKRSDIALKQMKFQNIKNLHFEYADKPNANNPNAITVIDVRCQGEFVLAENLAEQGWTASFYRNVDVQRHNPDKTVDRLTADEVHITMQQAAQPAVSQEDVPQKTGKMDFGKINPVLFVARGTPGNAGQKTVPARLEVKQNNDVTLIGDEIFLDLRKNFLSLSAREQTMMPNTPPPFVEMILAGQYTIRSERCVQYTLGQNGTFGQFASNGRGNLSGRIGEGASVKNVLLEWNELQIEPHPVVKNQIAVKLSKGIKAQMTDFGTMTADKLDICVKTGGGQMPAAGNAARNTASGFPLDNAIVRDNVVFTTSGGTCRVNRFDIFFTDTAANGAVIHSRYLPNVLMEQPPVPPGSTDAIRLVQHLEPLKPISPQPVQPAGRVANIVRNPSATPSKPAGVIATQNLLGIQSSPQGGKFEMTGNLMRMQVKHFAGQSSAEVIEIEGNVKLKETAAVVGQGIEIGGDKVMIWNPADPTTHIRINGQTSGSDAVFKGRGVELTAKELHLSRAENRFWSPGAGRIIANVNQIKTPNSNPPNNVLGSPNNKQVMNKLVVDWNKDMHCDGKVITFLGQPDRSNSRVRAVYQTQSLRCNVMEIHLNRKVMFFDDPSVVEPKAELIRCAHDVDIRNQQLDAAGKQKSMEEATVKQLHYYLDKNYIIAEGPGTLRSTFIGSGTGFGKGSSGENKLNHLAVWFQESIQGTLLGDNKTGDITGRVVAAYCPAASWNDTIDLENVAAARKTGYTLECEKMRITAVPNPAKPEDLAMELTASENAVIDGGGVYGKAKIIKYNQAKNVVNFEGNVKVRTNLSGQTADHAAQSIQYNIGTGSVNFVQANGLTIGN